MLNKSYIFLLIFLGVIAAITTSNFYTIGNMILTTFVLAYLTKGSRKSSYKK